MWTCMSTCITTMCLMSFDHGLIEQLGAQVGGLLCDGLGDGVVSHEHMLIDSIGS